MLSTDTKIFSVHAQHSYTCHMVLIKIRLFFSYKEIIQVLFRQGKQNQGL